MTKKHKEITRRFKMQLYFGSLVVIITEDLEKLAEKYDLEKEGICESDALYWNDEKNFYCAFRPSEITPGKIAHEAYHVMCRVYKNINAGLSVYETETEAYFLEWIVDRINDVTK